MSPAGIARERRRPDRGEPEAKTRSESGQSACNKIRNVSQKVSHCAWRRFGVGDLQQLPGAQNFGDAPGLRNAAARVMGRYAIEDFRERPEAVSVERLKRRL